MIVTLSAAASWRTRRVSSAAITSATASSATSLGGASSTRPIGTPASVRTLPPPLSSCRSLSRPLPFALPTRASIHIALPAMTATAAGQSAMDPEDRGPGEAEPVGDGVRLGDAADVGTARPGADQTANAAARIAALRARLIVPDARRPAVGLDLAADRHRVRRLPPVQQAIGAERDHLRRDVLREGRLVHPAARGGVELDPVPRTPNAQIVAGHTTFQLQAAPAPPAASTWSSRRSASCSSRSASGCTGSPRSAGAPRRRSSARWRSWSCAASPGGSPGRRCSAASPGCCSRLTGSSSCSAGPASSTSS